MEQTNIFGYLYPDYKITKPIRLIELFAGIGSQAMALRDIGADFEHHKVVELDKYAIRSYNAIHGTAFDVLDIRDIHAAYLEIANKDKYCYIMAYSFPCQDLSKAGKQKGMSKGSNTRSGLLWEVERILNELKTSDSLPQVLLMENVPDVVGNKNYKDFMQWYAALESMGYQSYYKVLNAKDYGIPQNRERCFMVSILGEYNYIFPKGIPLELRLKDILEDEVDEKYYLSEKMIKGFIASSERHKEKGTGFQWKPKKGEDIANCLRTNGALCKTDNSIIVEGNIYPNSGNPQAGRIYNDSGISPSLDTCSGGNRQPKLVVQGGQVVIPEATKKGYSLANEGDGVYINRPHQKRGVVQNGMIQTLKTSCSDVGVVVNENRNLRIRKLTPLECWRLMGFTDEDFYKAKAVNSDSQLYKQAGNSIVKQVLMAILKKMIGGRRT